MPHKGDIQHDTIEGVYTVAEDFPRLIGSKKTMEKTPCRRTGAVYWLPDAVPDAAALYAVPLPAGSGAP